MTTVATDGQNWAAAAPCNERSFGEARAMTIDDTFARAFAADWIDSWNAHDLDRVLSHYAPDIVFLSPIAQRTVGTGRVTGIEALRDYWGKALATRADLRFELLGVFVGHECLTLHYRNHRGQAAAETFEFGADGKVVRSFACYSE